MMSVGSVGIEGRSDPRGCVDRSVVLRRDCAAEKDGGNLTVISHAVWGLILSRSSHNIKAEDRD